MRVLKRERICFGTQLPPQQQRETSQYTYTYYSSQPNQSSNSNPNINHIQAILSSSLIGFISIASIK